MTLALTPEQRQEVVHEIEQQYRSHLYGPVYLGQWGVGVIERIEALEREVAELKGEKEDDA